MRLPLAIFLFGVVVLALLWIGILHDGERQRIEAIEDGRQDTTNLAIAFREDVLRTITALDQLTLAVKAEYAVDPEHYRLPDWLLESPFLSNIALQISIADENGVMRQSSLGLGDEPVSIADRPHFLHHLDRHAEEPYISAPVLGRVSGKWSIQITRRLERADGSFAGVLVISLDPFYLSELYDSYNLGHDGVVGLVGRDGVVRARRAQTTSDLGQDLSRSVLFQKLRQASQGSYIADSMIDGVGRIYSYSAVPNYPLVVVVGLGCTEVMTGSRRQRRISVMAGGGLSLCLIGLIGVLLREAIFRRRREEALASQAALLQTLLDVTPAAIWVKDGAGRYSLVNDAASRMLGVAKERVPVQSDGGPSNGGPIGERPDAALEPPGTAAERAAWDAAALEQPGQTVVGECDAMIEGESHRFLAFQRASEVGDGLRIVGAAMDVTSLRHAEAALRAEMAQRERAEAQLRQAQKMEAIGQLTGGMAHDFNNLLTTILGNLDLAQSQESDPGKLRLLRNAERAAERGAKLVDHLLTFARKQHLRPEPVDLNHLLQEMGPMIERAVGPLVQIEVALDAEPWPALADATQVELATLNLAVNARDAMPGGGRLRIETGKLRRGDPGRLPELAPGDYVVLSILDTGTGMTKEVQAKAFDPFFTTKEVGKGSGLGLSQVYGMARQSSGTVKIDSAPGLGTRLRIYLPRAVAAQRPRPLAAEPVRQQPMRRGTILVVDDEEAVRELVAATLADAGYAVLRASNGRAALVQLAAQPVDLAVVDMAMPDMPGVEMARIARRRRPDLPILFITGYADTGSAALIAGARLLGKPFKSARLVAEIDEMLERASPRAAG